MLPLAADAPPLAPYAVVIGLGFVLGALGSAYKARAVIVIGILLILASTLLFQIRVYGAGT